MGCFDGLLNDQAQRYASFDLQGTLNARKRNKKISEVLSFVGNPVFLWEMVCKVVFVCVCVNNV